MITVRRSSERGHIEYSWLDTRHSFSFGNYYDEKFVGFHSLRVINEDVIKAGTGFGKHFHDDMEILTYVLEGALEHKDNTGSGGVLRRGDVQRMSAGRGIIHSEFNHSKDAPVHLLQIWIIPRDIGIDPSYEQKSFPDALKKGKLFLLASGDGRDGSLHMAQDADVYASILDVGQELAPQLKSGKHVWLQIVRGALDVNGTALAAGDGAAIEVERDIRLMASEETEFLLFDLA